MAQRDYRELAAVFAGGALGTLARAGLRRWPAATRRAGPGPRSRSTSSGAFLLGYFATRLLERLPTSSYRRPLLGTGLCGGLTTFSTMQVETLKMIEHGHWGLAVGYTVASIARDCWRCTLPPSWCAGSGCADDGHALWSGSASCSSAASGRCCASSSTARWRAGSPGRFPSARLP